MAPSGGRAITTAAAAATSRRMPRSPAIRACSRSPTPGGSGCARSGSTRPSRSAAGRRRPRRRSSISATCRSTPSTSSSARTTTSCGRRIPDYRRADLDRALSVEKSVFEYWTHALAYVPTRDYRFFLPDDAAAPAGAAALVRLGHARRAAPGARAHPPRRRRSRSATSTTTMLVEKDHPWASRKPSKRALQLALPQRHADGQRRATGMLKTYELTDRHFGWPRPPRPASERQVIDYLLDRALRAQGVVSLELDPPRSTHARKRGRSPADRGAAATRAAGAGRARRRRQGRRTGRAPETLRRRRRAAHEPVHLLSPFDPLVIQRRRLSCSSATTTASRPTCRRTKRHVRLLRAAGAGRRPYRRPRSTSRPTARRASSRSSSGPGWTAAPRPATRRASRRSSHRFERFQFDPPG